MSSTHHRSSWLKQSNKGHKGGKHRSNREVDRLRRGKVLAGGGSGGDGRLKASMGTKISRQERVRNANMDRKKKRSELVAQRRAQGLEVAGAKGDKAGGSPRCVLVVPLCEAATQVARDVAYRVLSAGDLDRPSLSTAHIAAFPEHKLRVSVIVHERTSGTFALLDAVKVADVIIFCTSVTSGQGLTATKSSLGKLLENAVDASGAAAIANIKAQGCPSVVGVVHGTGNVKQKHRGSVKKQFDHYFLEEFGAAAKVVTFQKSMEADKREADALIRAVAQIKPKFITWRKERAYLVANSALQVGSNVAVSGYLRGKPLRLHQLIHVPGEGTFQVAKVDVFETDPHPLKARRGDMAMEPITLVSDPTRVPSLDEEVEPDVMGGEQTWPTAEEMGIEVDEETSKPTKKLVPKGTSAYQAAWLVGNEGYDDDTELVEIGEDADDEQVKEADIAAAKAMWKEKRQKMADDELEFPDEVEVPLDVPARLRLPSIEVSRR